MNAKEARKAIEYDVLNDGSWEAKGYLAALEGPEVSALVKALEKIVQQRMPNLSDDLIERSMQLSGLWASLKMIAHDALAEFKGEK